MIEIALLAQQITTFLAPFLPTLLRLGEKAEEEVVTKAVDQGWDKAQNMWGKLHPALQTNPKALTAAEEVAGNPDDETYRTMLTRRLTELLAREHALAEQLADDTKSQVVQRVIAEDATIRNITQNADGGVPSEQEVSGTNKAVIEGVEQNIRGGA